MVVRATKESGFFWLGQVPITWQIARGKDVFRRMTLMVREEDEVVTCFRDGITTLRKKRREDGFTFALKEIGYQGVRAGHLVISAMDAFAGAIGISDSDGKCSPVYSVCASKDINVAHMPFFCWVLRNMAASGYIQSVAKGIRERSTDFRYSELEDAHFSLPSLIEQRRIADWLDLQTTRIDKRRALLAKKRDLLSDLKTTTISEATSFGLDRTVATKFSGIDAIGSIPQHWHIFRLKAMTSKIGSGKTPLGGSSVYSSSGTVFLRSQNIWDDGIRLNDVVYISDQIHHEMNATAVKPKDILLNITGASIGRSALVPVGFPAANVSQHVCIIRLRNKGVADYVALTMLSRFTKAQMAIDQIGAARDGLNFESIGQLPIPLPPTDDERRKIVDRVSNRVANINRQITLIDQLDDLLQQQRKALIHEAVTGKIDLS